MHHKLFSIVGTTMAGWLLSVFLLPYPPNIPSHGSAWPTLAQQVDALVKQVMQDNHIVGMTVAVTKEGRLVLSKGYGYAKANTLEMLPNMRTRIGSVSKATVTGPVAVKLMEEKGIDSKTQNVYGINGVLNSPFYDFYRHIGTRRFYPILAMAIAPDDKVYTWYVNGKYSIGTSWDLDRYQGLQEFTLPDDQDDQTDYELTDIRAIAISKSNKVYVWYNDATRSIGTPGDLDRYEAPDKNKEVKLPDGKSMLNIVGIAIAKSNDHVYVWYDDGTVSSGTSLDFTKYFTGRTYATPSNDPGGMSRYDIRGIGIASDDHVYVWYSNDKASSGWSRDLDFYRSPYSYSLAAGIEQLDGDPAFDRNIWWEQIVLQDLLDHTAGFQRSGDTKGAAQMFGVSEGMLTYGHVHKHFISTRPLRWSPGMNSSYSNHGFGLWTLIVPALSGQSYEDYAVNNYLVPLGLQGKVRPMTASPDELDAYPYNVKNGQPVELSFKDAGLGLAAGGWTASAKSLLWITRNLARTYEVDELDAMGWGKNSKGKLAHDGLIDGGAAYVAMFPEGYISQSGKDLSEVHVALAANTRVSTSALRNLASKIALAVPDSDIPPLYDLWLVLGN